ncbi:MAG: damage-inducible protein, partial [Chloroflexi bacterium]|nr:damage-inducible protein [Chloroflexota bacterium]
HRGFPLCCQIRSRSPLRTPPIPPALAISEPNTPSPDTSRQNRVSSYESTLSFYNREMARWQAGKDAAHSEGNDPDQIDEFVDTDPKKISWSFSLKADFRRGKPLTSQDGHVVPCLYRPFTKQWLFCSQRFNHSVYQTPRIFPDAELPNRAIAVSGTGARAGFSALMMDVLPNLHTIDSGQCFPFWLYERGEDSEEDLLGERVSGFRRRDAITDYALRHFRDAYPSESVSREDVFHYIYGLLHSEDYRNRFRANLAKELPRIPCVKPVENYRAFRDAGKRLGELHVGYEDVDPFPATIDTGGKLLVEDPEVAYRVAKMKHPGSGRNKDQATVIYNYHITIRDIPEAAWDYVVNGKPALSWVMERQRVRTDKASGIVSDANRYAIETVGDPRYPLDLFLRVITVSLETMKIVRTLPELTVD